jgi:hypothetical protein
MGGSGKTIPSTLAEESRLERHSSGAGCLEPDTPVDFSCLKYRAAEIRWELSKVPRGEIDRGKALK